MNQHIAPVPLDKAYRLIDPVLRRKGYDDPQRIRLETPAPVEPTGPKGRRRTGAGRTDYRLCVQVGDMPRPLPVAVLVLKAVNPHAVAALGERTPGEIVDSIVAQGRIVADALARLNRLLLAAG